MWMWLRAVIRDGVTLARSLELTVQWDGILRLGPVFMSLCRVDVLLSEFSDFISAVRQQMPPAPHLRELPLQRRRPRTRPGPRCVREQQRW